MKKEVREVYGNRQKLMKYILEINGIKGPTSFYQKTGMCRDTYRKFVRGDRNIKVQTIITVCIALQVHYILVERILSENIYTLDINNDVHYAYICALHDPYIKDIYDCNVFLASLGISKNHYLGGMTEKE